MICREFEWIKKKNRATIDNFKAAIEWQMMSLVSQTYLDVEEINACLKTKDI